MAQCMRATGWIIKHMVKVDLFTQMVMFTMVNGSKIKLMAMEFTHI
jgi:hypothetical protein